MQLRNPVLFLAESTDLTVNAEEAVEKISTFNKILETKGPEVLSFAIRVIALIEEDFPVPASPNSRQLFARLPLTNASVLSMSFCFAMSYPTRSSR